MFKRILWLSLFTTSLSVNAIGSTDSFWNGGEDGFFWYKDPLEEEVKEPKKEKIIPPVAKVEPKESKPTKEVPFGSVKWLRENLDKYLVNAIDNPTQENVLAYLMLQRLAIDKSEAFAYAGQMAVEGNPLLDEIARSPLGGTTRLKRDSYINAEQSHFLKKLFNKVGLFFVFKNNCYICDEQAEVMKIAQRQFNVQIKAVSLDIPNENSKSAKLFPDYIVNPNISEQLSIRALPSTFILDSSTRQIKPLLQGFVTISDLNRRLITAAQKYKLLPTSDFRYIKPFDDNTSLANVFNNDVKDRLNDYLSKQKADSNESGYIDPNILVNEILNSKAKEYDSQFFLRGY